MATGSLLALLDDIATVLDDIAVLSKTAAQKTAGVLGDDLALNAQQVSGVRAERELPVVWAVALGSLRNKLILVPIALLLSSVAPWAVTPLLMLGGAWLCLEGVEKLVHAWWPSHTALSDDETAHQAHLQALADDKVDLAALEREKIQGAIRTDFVLSAEILVITLGTVAEVSFLQRSLVLAFVGLVMTIGVYGLVAVIVKLDDLGLYLSRDAAGTPRQLVLRKIGAGLLIFAPFLMRALAVLGTLAMFLVGGGIVLHGLPFLAHAFDGLGGTGWLGVLVSNGINLLAGVVIGALCLALWHLGEIIYKTYKTTKTEKIL